MSSALDEQLTLPDGRILSYCQFGRIDGRPVFYFHGFPSSRLEAALSHEVALKLGLRVIAADRPGYGRSSPQPGRTLSNWAEDVAELADHLSIARFDVAAVSGGGPYALACAYYLAHRVVNIVVACGVGPYQRGIMRDMAWPARFGLFLAHRQSKLLLRVLLFLPWLFLRTMPRQLLRIFARLSQVTDKEALSEPNVIGTLAVALAEGVRPGFSGILQDMQIYSHPWGFNLENIKATLRIWHGEMDRVVPVSHGRYVSAHVVNSESRFFIHEAHFSVPINHMKELLAVFER